MSLPKFTADMSKDDRESMLVQARKARERLKAIAHETRLVILCILSQGERSVSDLEKALAMPQATVSQQLARLRFDGMVAARREGRMIYYSIADDAVSTLVKTLYDLYCKPDR
ncbi:ArsR/SmtB family transcription factor [Hoeflea prorocentri]|uniref:Metalloregulator ArsR/SmtB family transcription factor n=1 Tax=Hoeflea prorocentri TaxID=1922333 RepID=A0A9X3UII1_9HYPH|nr:metalloregulator ArsR/SmtB family transcription factor [Hoeflea prorocentri]MCY6381473.1 metalloregulator ArsR/SmtB family transcription factor [Hoeflea prorocentri]MDA5399273.1 metalloregulator ArsR/SmtB family transcription factor [Hoeflea prorocentri]